MNDYCCGICLRSPRKADLDKLYSFDDIVLFHWLVLLYYLYNIKQNLDDRSLFSLHPDILVA